MEIKVKYKKEVSTTITRCYQDCPYFYLDGGPGPGMACNHPDTGDIYIISHPDCDTGFPSGCPLLKPCVHNERSRYTHGFQCNDCDTFFPKESPTYRRCEYLNTLWMRLHNIGVDFHRAGRKGTLEDDEVRKMRDKIGIGIKHDNYEELIAEAEIMINNLIDTSGRIKNNGTYNL